MDRKLYMYVVVTLLISGSFLSGCSKPNVPVNNSEEVSPSAVEVSEMAIAKQSCNIFTGAKKVSCEQELVKQIEIQKEEEKKMATYQNGDSLEKCDELTTDGAKVQCRDNVIFTLARKNKDSKICEKIEDPVGKSLCKAGAGN